MEACTYSTRTKKPEGGGLCYSRLWGEVSGKSLSQKKKIKKNHKNQQKDGNKGKYNCL